MPVKCPICSREFQGERLNARHIALCNPNTSPAVEPCLCGHESTSLTQMKRHRKGCAVWQQRDAETVKQNRMKATTLSRYGVENANQSEVIRAKTAKTNLERFGAVNPFCREATTFDKVQSALDGKRPVMRGADNPFARDGVKLKIRAYWETRHGVFNPQQVEGIKSATRKTNMERYGGVFRASPVLDAKARQTNRGRYGDEIPQRTEQVKGKQRATNIERYGVHSTNLIPEVRQKQLERHFERYGSHFFASEVGKAKIREVLRKRYGVDHPSHMDGWWNRVMETNRQRYGVDHALQLREFIDKQQNTNMQRYGSPIPGLRNRGMNGLETTVYNMIPAGILKFTGDGKYWRRLPLLGQYKNPDFVVVGPDPEHPYRGATKVVEIFGNFWHSRLRTGKAPFDHEQELIRAYAEAGLECLIIWESEVKSDPAQVQSRILSFVSNAGM